MAHDAAPETETSTVTVELELNRAHLCVRPREVPIRPSPTRSAQPLIDLILGPARLASDISSLTLIATPTTLSYS
jgi:hypothetical protein